MAAVCRGEIPELPAEPEVRRSFVDAVRRHRVAPLAHVTVRATDPELADKLKIDRDTAMIRHLSAAVVLDSLNDVLDGIEWAVFKGPFLSEHAHPAPGLRSYNDVDLIVSPKRLREVSGRLLAAGWQVADYRDMLRNSHTPGEMHWISPNGVLVDLHWSMINMRKTRRRFAVDTEALLARRRSVQIGLSSTWTLDHADSLAHVCLHAALTGADRMLLILDIDQLSRHTEDWAEVASRVHEWRAAPPVALVLSRAQTLLKTPLPDDLNRQLRTTHGFRLVTGAADRIAPVPALRQDASVARLVSRAARPGAGRTLAVVGRNSFLGMRNRLTGSHHRSSDPATREPADADALETYLSAVEAEAAHETAQ